MSWTRLDDLLVEWPAWDGVSYAARWHYLCLVQACSRAQRWDGRLPETRARRVSDVDDPSECVGELVRAGLVYVIDGEVVIVRIEDHIPPKSIRNNANDSKIRMRRKRAHDRGDHTLCLLKSCPQAPVTPPVTPAVTRNTRTGQDRNALTEEPTTEAPPAARVTEPWPPAARSAAPASESTADPPAAPPETATNRRAPRCSVCKEAMEVLEPEQTTHPTCEPS